MWLSEKRQELLIDKLRFVLGLLALLIAFSTGAVHAQDSTTDQPEAAAEARPDATASDPDSEATSAGDAALAYPAGLDNPAIDLSELQLRLIPLTVDQLGALAETWQRIVAAQTQAVVEETVRLSRLPEEQRAAARERVLELTADRDDGFDRFTAVVSNLQRKGGDEATIATYRAYRASIIVEEKQQADWRTLMTQAVSWVTSPEGGIQLAIRPLIMAAALFGLFIVARMTNGYARRLLERVPNISKLLQGFLAKVVYWITIALGLMIVLSALGVDITPLFAVFGGGAFILAFAMQETLGNLAAGLMIMINRPFDEGDYVTIAALSGTVKHVSVVSTTITTPDNQVIVIPNSKVWGDVITNVTASDTRRVDLVFGIGYNDSIEKAQAVLEEVVSAHPLVLKDPAPLIRVNELADSAVNFIVRPWTMTEDYWTVYWDLQRTVKEMFDARGISIPFPQADMHLHVAGSSTAAAFSALSGAGSPRTGEAKGFASAEHAADEQAADGTDRA